MSKSNFLNYKFLKKTDIALICILVMLSGLLVSRVVLSIGTIAFGVNALWGVHPKLWLRNKWWLLGVGWMAMLAVSYFWSTNHHYWGASLEVKLPILLLPVSFCFLPSFSNKQLSIYTVFVGLILLSGACYSVSFLFRNMAYYYEQYRISQVLPTPVGKDYIRFSLTIAFYIIWCVYFWPGVVHKYLKWFMAIAIVLLTVYLHILAAKSGLVAIYLFYISWGIYLSMRRQVLTGVAVLLILILGVSLATKYIPTFSQRIGYISYTYIVFKKGDQSGAYGDIGRLISYDIALKIIKANPLTGVGEGDMFDEMKKGYTRWYPQIADRDRLLPHNQFLTIAVGCGIPTLLVFCCWFFYPLTWLGRNRESYFFFIAWFILLFQLMIEPVLEIQYGVFVFSFFLLWQAFPLNKNRVATPL